MPTCPHRGMVWAGDHWDVVADGRARLLANIPLDEWIGLGDAVRA
jgi:hypothetical protein